MLQKTELNGQFQPCWRKPRKALDLEPWPVVRLLRCFSLPEPWLPGRRQHCSLCLKFRRRNICAKWVEFGVHFGSGHMNFSVENWACLFLWAANAAISLWVDALSALGSKFPRGNIFLGSGSTKMPAHALEEAFTSHAEKGLSYKVRVMPLDVVRCSNIYLILKIQLFDGRLPLIRPKWDKFRPF